MPSRVLLPFLLLVSGFCGISYEILYTKLLGNLLGDQFTINATVLLTFLAGIGLGTLYAHRFVRKLWLIEGGIGIYAAMLILSYGWIDHLLYAGLPQLGTSIPVCALVSILLLATPAFLVGCSVPLFAAYLSTLRSTRVFSTTYAIYNFGAALTALAMEFVLLRVMGLRATTLTLAVLNGVVAVGLLLLVRRAPVIPPPQHDRLHFSVRDLGAVVLASVASAIFQLMMIKVAECVIGPFNETFALVLAVVLGGLAVGSFVAGTFRLSFSGALITSLVGLVWLLAMHTTIVTKYADLRPLAVASYPLLVLLKLGLVVAMMGLPAVGFGATLPALLKRHRDIARESGELLFVSSMANVLGFVLMAFALHRFLDYGPLLLVVVILTVAGLVVHAAPRRVTWAGAALVVLAVAAQQGRWNESYLYFGHVRFEHPGPLKISRESPFFADRFKGYQDVFAITYRDGWPSFFINGYISIPLTTPAEKVAGAISVMFSPRTDEALVLGVGSGATAATVGLMFDHTDAVEINAVILANLYRMKQYNFDLEHMPSVTITHDDGIHFIKSSPKRYSLIVNTVTTPIYFSSSKLYTRDFLESVADRLTPDGIYTTWVDQDLGDRGVDIIQNTLSGVFDECWVSYLKSSYYLLVCSNEEIRPHQVDLVTTNERLARNFAEQHDLASRLIPYAVLTDSTAALRSKDDVPLNTLDFPVLEHEMARLKRNKLSDFNRRLGRALDLPRLRSAFEGELDWRPGEFLFWADQRLGSHSTLFRLLHAAVPAQLGDAADDYARAALEIAEELGTARGYYESGYRLYHRRLYRPAMRLLSTARDLDPQLADASYYLGRCHEMLGELEPARDCFLEVVRLRPDDDSAREALAELGTPRDDRPAEPDEPTGFE